MDRRSLISGALGGAAGVVVGREFVPSSVGAAADVDRSEFETLKARVAYLEGFHPPMPPPHVPTFSGAVSIPAGFVVPFGEVWDFDPDVTTTVEVAANVVVAGTLQMRPANPGVIHTLRFVDINDETVVGGGMEPIESDVGLWVIGAGALDAVGSPKTSWVRAASDIAAGATTVALAATPGGWLAGDRVVITPTAPMKNTLAAEYTDTTITSVNGSAVGLGGGVSFAHPRVDVGDGFILAAEVMNLTRNVKIEGTSSGHAHVFINSSVPQTIANIELAHMGPRHEVVAGLKWSGVLGRYALHFHMCGDGSVGSTVTNVVAHDCPSHVFVPHLSNGVTFTGCVSHNSYDEPFWWDGRASNTSPVVPSDGIVWESCIASLVNASPPWQGYALGGFVLGAGAGNVMRDCVAVGVQGNNGSAGFVWPEGVLDIWTFERCVAHNNRQNGIFVWQNNDGNHVIQDFVAYNCGKQGIRHGAYGNTYLYRNVFISGCREASVEVFAISASNLRFESMRCDGRGVSINGFVFNHHNAVAMSTTIVGGVVMVGQTGAQVATTSPVPNKVDLVDFIGCGPIAVAMNTNTHADSIFRVQDGASATTQTPTGSTAIAPFSSEVFAPAAPFPVLAAA
jgi:hypothetical protein